MTVAEEAGAIFIKRVVFRRRKNSDVSQRRAPDRYKKYEEYECLMQSDYLRGKAMFSQTRKTSILFRPYTGRGC